MAEYVQHEIERTIQDLEVLEKFKIFEKDEVLAIIKKRRDFEYRVRKVKKTKDDFLRYIAYEENLLKLIRIRKEKQGLTTDKTLIEKPVLDHIRRLFELCLMRFQADISIWLSYIDFSLSQKAYPHVANIYFKMLQIHNKDFLWIKFAKFEFEARNSSESARKIFLKAISFHPESQSLWLEYFRFEMLYCTKIRRRFHILSGTEDNDSDKIKSRDAIWNGELALIVFGHALKNHKNFAFAQNFLNMCSKFDYDLAIAVKEKILQEIRDSFGETEDYWNMLALEEMTKYVISMKNQGKIGTKDHEQQVQLKRETIVRCLMLYDKACTIYDNETMWSYYMKFRFDLLTKHNLNDKTSVSQLLFLCDKLWTEKKLSKHIFMKWAQLVLKIFQNDTNYSKKLYNSCLEASERWPNDIELHLFIACLMVKAPKFKKNDVEEYFEDCLTSKFVRINKTTNNEDVQTDCLIDFWELYLNHLLSNGCSERIFNSIIDKLFKISNFLPKRFGKHFKTYILDLLHRLFSIDRVRRFFNDKKTQTPITKEFFTAMLAIEQDCSKVSYSEDHIVNIYSDLVHYFGSSEPDIWMDYIKFALRNKRIQQVGAIYDKAIKSLNSDAVGRFVQGYALINCSV